jgi:cytochrome c oxidase subunit 3
MLTTAPRRATMTGLYVLLGYLVMLFSALTSALVVRKGLGGDWEAPPLPAPAYAGAAVLAASSALVEWARRRSSGTLWWTGAAAGVLFLLLQLAAWRALAEAGVTVAANPANAFFYLLSGVHGAHVAGGVGGLVYAARRPAAVTPAAWYWHAMALLWFYALLLVNR